MLQMGLGKEGGKQRSGTGHSQQHLGGDALEQHIPQTQTKPDHVPFFKNSKPIKTLVFLDFLALSRYQALLRSSLPCCTITLLAHQREYKSQNIKQSKMLCLYLIRVSLQHRFLTANIKV